MLPESQRHWDPEGIQSNFNGNTITNEMEQKQKMQFQLLQLDCTGKKKNLHYHTSDFLQEEENNFLKLNLFHPITDLEWVSST